jgi:hypothetical protein
MKVAGTKHVNSREPDELCYSSGLALQPGMRMYIGSK